MELLDGADLKRIVETTGPLPIARTVHVLRQVCAALAEAHERGLVHRDIKASNLMLCRQGLDLDVVKVVDFGLVKTSDSPADLTRGGEICGTFPTIAPEVLSGAGATARSDIYSLGAVGCYLLTGELRFDDTSPIAFAVKHLTDEPILPSRRGVEIPGELEDLLGRCFAKDPGERPASVLELARRLDECDGFVPWSQSDAKLWWKEHGERLDTGPGRTENRVGEASDSELGAHSRE